MIYGNIDSIKKVNLDELEALYEVKCGKDEFIAPEMAEKLAELTTLFNREIAVYIDRNGNVKRIAVGDDGTAPLGEIASADTRRGFDRLSLIRCIHTHPNGSGELSELDMTALIGHRFDCMAALGVRAGKLTTAQAAFLAERDENAPGGFTAGRTQLFSAKHIPSAALMELIRETDEKIDKQRVFATDTDRPERAVLAGIDEEDGGYSMAELERLADTAGAETVGRVVQKKERCDSGAYFGTGKVEELAMECQRLSADLVIVNDELTARQQQNIEEKTGCRVIDRPTLILDIFAQRASSYEGQLQVELAQLQYRSKRLTGSSAALSRLGGGIGTRGPGESKLESDKRHIRTRVEELQRKLDEVRRRRDVIRAKRDKSGIPVIALVGYTNAGKSTLLNALSGAGVRAEDKLFATLDPVSRQIELPDGTEIMLVDTVGFVDKLPHEFVDAFRSTLEEAKYATVLLHVIDSSAPDRDRQIKVVEEVVSSLGAGDKPMIRVYNKADLTSVDTGDGVAISARHNENIDKLLASVGEAVHRMKREVSLLVPYTAGKALDFLHRNCLILSEDYTGEGTVLQVRVSDAEWELALSMGAMENRAND